MRQTLKKNEIIRSKSIIDILFSQGISVMKYPIKLVYFEKEISEQDLLKSKLPPQKLAFLFSVPKKNIKLAVNRNKIKRRIKEIIRKNKNAFIQPTNNKQLFVAVIFVEKQEKSYQELEISLRLAFEKLNLSLNLSSNI